MMINLKKTPPKNHPEKGSAFFYILLGVILFGTLAFTVSRGMRGGQTNQLNRQQIKLAVSDILDYAQKADQAVQRTLRKGCSENDVSFHTSLWGHTDYEHSPVVANKCNVFHAAGGNLQWRPSPDYASNNVTWNFNRHIVVKAIGTEPPVWNSPYGGELVMALEIKSKELCMAINDGAGIENDVDHWMRGTKPPYDPAEVHFYRPFNGTYIAYVTLDGQYSQLIGKATGCVTLDPTKDAPLGPYVFYYTLIAR